MESPVTQNWIAIAALLAGVGALIYGVLHGRAEMKGDGERQYTERLERIVEQSRQVQTETIIALRGMTEEMRMTRSETLAMHQQNQEDNRAMRVELRDLERTLRER